MKKLRILLYAVLIALFGAAGVSADVAAPFSFLGTEGGKILFLCILTAIVLAVVGLVIWLILRARRRK